MRKYLEQYARMLRFFEKMKHSSKDYIHAQPSIIEGYKDDMYSFFQTCWHLRDWIRHDGSIPRGVRDAIVQEAESTHSLLVCADLANASKHLRLIHPARVGANDRKLIITIDQNARVSWEYIIELGDGTEISAIDAAEEAVRAWTDILSRNRLSVVVDVADI